MHLEAWDLAGHELKKITQRNEIGHAESKSLKGWILKKIQEGEGKKEDKKIEKEGIFNTLTLKQNNFEELINMAVT